jgi:hypothetical protein
MVIFYVTLVFLQSYNARLYAVVSDLRNLVVQSWGGFQSYDIRMKFCESWSFIWEAEIGVTSIQPGELMSFSLRKVSWLKSASSLQRKHLTITIEMLTHKHPVGNMHSFLNFWTGGRPLCFKGLIRYNVPLDAQVARRAWEAISVSKNCPSIKTTKWRAPFSGCNVL